MLILQRKTGHEIVIDGSIRLEVLSIRGKRVRLGIVAPENVSIRRCRQRADEPELAHPNDDFRLGESVAADSR